MISVNAPFLNGAEEGIFGEHGLIVHERHMKFLVELVFEGIVAEDWTEEWPLTAAKAVLFSRTPLVFFGAPHILFECASEDLKIEIAHITSNLANARRIIVTVLIAILVARNIDDRKHLIRKPREIEVLNHRLDSDPDQDCEYDCRFFTDEISQKRDVRLPAANPAQSCVNIFFAYHFSDSRIRNKASLRISRQNSAFLDMIEAQNFCSHIS